MIIGRGNRFEFDIVVHELPANGQRYLRPDWLRREGKERRQQQHDVNGPETTGQQTMECQAE